MADVVKLLNEDVNVKDQNLRNIRRSLRDNSKIFDLDDETFTRTFRLNKAAFKYVLQEISPYLKKPQRSTGIALETKLAAALKLLSEGSYQLGAGSDFNVGLAQPTISMNFEEFLNAAEKTLCTKWINLDRSDEEINETKMAFYKKFNFPGIVGCIGCSHIRLLTPAKTVKDSYRDENGSHSLNVLIMCDQKMRILYADTRPGSISDAEIWETSELKTYMQSNLATESECWLIGNNSFPLEPHLMTPFVNPAEDSPEVLYNETHCKARYIVERTIGLLRNRFKCLTNARQLHYKPDKVQRMTNVCVALHNICIHFKCTHVQMLRRQEIPIERILTDTNDLEAVLLRNQIAASLADR